MINIDDIIKRSRYLNMSNKQQEYDKYHAKSKLLMESNFYRFDNVKFLLQHWESLHEDQIECFKLAINILDESYENDKKRDFNYIKSYIINEITPTVRDAKQTARYLKYKTTRMKNRIGEKIKKNSENIVDNTKAALDNIKNTNSKGISIVDNKVKKNDKEAPNTKEVKDDELHEAYVQILDVVDKYNHCDRILENIYTIQKRFNIMNMVESVDISNPYQLRALTDSICECINTYDTDFKTRFNTTLETCFYFLSRKDKNFNKPLVLEEVVNNFISKDFSESELLDMKTMIDESIVFNNLDKESVDFIYKEIPFEEASDLAKPFLSNNNIKIKNIGKTIGSVSNNMTDDDVRKIFSSIRNSITEGVQLESCIKDIDTLLNKVSYLYTGDNFNKLCSLESEKIKNITESDQSNYISILNKYACKYDKSESILVMEFDLFEESFKSDIVKTAKDIVNDFKIKKMKKPTDIRTCVSKMFTKSPNQIIDGTPNFLSWLRLSYVVGATAINPVLGGITLLIDQFIAMKLKRRDISKMITVFENERKNVAEKLKKADEKDKKNLKEYDKYLSDGLEKLKEYEDELLTDAEKDARDYGDDYDIGKDFSIIVGENDTNQYDFDLEPTSFEKLFENSNYFSKEYFTENIRKSIDNMNEDTIDTITDIACKYPCIISTSSLYSILKEQLTNLNDKYSGSQKWIRMSCLTSNLRKLDPESSNYFVTNNDDCTNVFEVINGLEDLFVEISIDKTLKATNESASTMIKNITNKLRKTIQKVSDTNKEVSRKIDSSVNTFISGIQRSIKNDNREAIIRGSIIPSASKVIKTAIVDGAVALVNPAIAIILALGQFAMGKKMQKKERQLVLDEIEVEIEMCKRYLRQAEDQNDLDAQKKLLRIQRNLERQRQRILYNMKLYWKQDVPSTKNDD